MLIWTFVYAILFVATFGGLILTTVYLGLGIWYKDRSIIYFGLKFLLFTILAGMVLYLLLGWLVNRFWNF